MLGLLGVLALFVVGFGVSGGFQQGNKEKGKTLLVAAAANMRFALEEIGPSFQEESGIQVIFTFGSTGNFSQQIINGAPVDVFIAADVEHIEELRTKGLVLEDTQQVYALGRLVLAVNRQHIGLVAEVKDLMRPQVKLVAIANPELAPYGQAAKEVLINLGLWEALQPKLVYGENVSQALQHIQSGNAEAGFIPLSIANVPEIEYQLIDDALHQPLRQAVAVIRGTQQEASARQFIAFVNGPKGRSILKRYGFSVPGEF